MSGRVGRTSGLLPRELGAAEEIRAATERSGGDLSVTLRSLRDEFRLPRGLLGRRAPTPLERQIIDQALASVGVRPAKPLIGLRLNDRVSLGLVEPTLIEKVRRGRAWRFTGRTARLTYGFVGVALTIAAAIELLSGGEAPAPEPMNGSVNIAVASFRTEHGADEGTERAARSIARGVYTQIHGRVRRAAPVLGTQTRSPREIGALENPERDAPRVARRIHADIVIYAQLEQSPVVASLNPGFYVSPHILHRAEELSGSYSFGSALVERAPASNAVTQRRLEKRLTERTTALAQFVLGLSYFEAHDFQRAYQSFLTAARSKAWSGGRPEVIHLFLGNAALKQGKLALAQRHFRTALLEKPGYLRARFALTEATFLRHKGRQCERGEINAKAVNRALAGYVTVERATRGLRGNPTAILRAKAQYGAGRANFCLSQALAANRWTEGVTAFKSVVAAHDAGVPGITEEATEAHAGLGLIAVPADDDPEPRPGLLKAEQEYLAAIELSGGERALPERFSRQAVFRSNLADIYRRLGDVTRSKQQLQRAVELERNQATRRSYAVALRRLG